MLGWKQIADFTFALDVPRGCIVRYERPEQSQQPALVFVPGVRIDPTASSSEPRARLVPIEGS